MAMTVSGPQMDGFSYSLRDSIVYTDCSMVTKIHGYNTG